jgi:cyclophilin family peptidyl-prolyl cis-trans isomerase
MKNYIIVAVVLIIAFLSIYFLLKNRDSIGKEVNNVGTNLTNPVNDKVDLSSENNKNNTKENITKNNDTKKMNQEITSATINTNMGNIVVEFYSKDAPNTVANFVKLAGSGFYNNVKFHRVIKGFMIQGGDPLTKDDSKMSMWGTGGPGYSFPDEINTSAEIYKTGYKRGVLAMANSGPNTNGSQFFIMHADYPLPPLYAIFGRVVSGLEVVDKIANTKTDAGDRPTSPIIINSITLK